MSLEGNSMTAPERSVLLTMLDDIEDLRSLVTVLLAGIGQEGVDGRTLLESGKETAVLLAKPSYDKMRKQIEELA